jgi:hypothetical protein
MRGFGLDIRGGGLGVSFGEPGAVGDAGTMSRWTCVVLGRWFHHGKVRREGGISRKVK